MCYTISITLLSGEIKIQQRKKPNTLIKSNYTPGLVHKTKTVHNKIYYNYKSDIKRDISYKDADSAYTGVWTSF